MSARCGATPNRQSICSSQSALPFVKAVGTALRPYSNSTPSPSSTSCLRHLTMPCHATPHLWTEQKHTTSLVDDHILIFPRVTVFTRFASPPTYPPSRPLTFPVLQVTKQPQRKKSLLTSQIAR